MLDPAFYTAPVILPGPSTVPAVNGQAPSWNTDGTFAGWTSAGLTSGPLSQFAATTSLQLAGVITDETGTGLLVFGTSPTLVTPLIGTPTSGVLTNCTGLPLTTGVTGTLGHLNLGSGGGGATKFLREDSTYQTITLSPPAGSGTELQYRVNATTFGAVTGSTVVGGNVGIGATALVPLHVNVGVNQNIWMRSSTSNPNISFANDGGAAFVTGSIDGLTLILNAVALGNVGIGIIPNGATLHIAGSNAVLKLTDTGIGGHTYWLYPRAGTIAGQFGLYDETAGAYRWLVDSSGNFGVNTLAPSGAQVVITSATSTKVGLVVTGATSHSVPLFQLNMTATPSGNVFEVNSYGGSSGNVVKLTSAGNFGIGTTPGARLHAAGPGGSNAIMKLTDTDVTGHTFWLYPRAIGVAGNFALYDETAGVYRWLVDINGNFGIGQTSFGAGSIKVFAHAMSNPPSASPENCYQLYCADQAAGNSCPYFRTENGATIKLFQAAHINDPTGGSVIDVEARTGINTILDLLEANGLAAV